MTPVPALAHVPADLGVPQTGALRWLAVAARLATVRGISTVLFRVSQDLGRAHPLAGLVVKQLNHLLTGADLAWQAQVGPGLSLFHPTGVVIGPDVVLGARCAIQGSVTLGAARQRGLMYGDRVDSPVIGDDVRVGAGAVVVGPITVGSGGIIGANAAVIHDCPPGSLTVGVPAVSRPR